MINKTTLSSKKQIVFKILNQGVENIVPGKNQLNTLLLSNKKLNVYFGIDPTAIHIHLGHAVPLRKLQQFAELGHNVYFLIGDFTAMIGDTSDKNTERPVLSRDEVEKNFQTYKNQANKIVDFNKVKVVHNSDWLSKLGFVELLEYASLFSVNDFISRNLIRNRLTAGKRVCLSEVIYPIMQGYDSYYLNTDIQLGGTDQIFNMQAGRTFNKIFHQKESFVIANRFLLGTDGRKMSKSLGNAIWLDDTPEDIFGKIMSLKDELLLDYFILATNYTDKQVKVIEKELQSGSKLMKVKKLLARQVIRELHGKDLITKAEQHFVKTIQKKLAPKDAPIVQLQNKEISIDNFFDLIVETRTVTSRSEIKRLLKQGALYLNGKKISPDAETISINRNETVVRVGKRRYIYLKSP